MSSIAKDSDKNGMSARNLAICCPNLFIGSYAQRVLDGRQFQAMMYLMEFFIVNPHAFLPVETAATIVQETDDCNNKSSDDVLVDVFCSQWVILFS